MTEKDIESRFNKHIKEKGGKTYKLSSFYVSGLPDRMCLMPGGKMFFAELKAPGKKPRKLQEVIHRKIRALGFTVLVIDSLQQIQDI